MTNQEAFEILSVFDFEKISISGKAKDVAEYTGAISIAVDALEKQIPQKPNNDGYPHCPTCDKLLPKNNEHYCIHCGQAIDWSEEVEE